MAEEANETSNDSADDFAARAKQSSPGMLKMYWSFLVHRKKWWMTPIIVLLLVLGLLVTLSASGLAPFIYAMW